MLHVRHACRWRHLPKAYTILASSASAAAPATGRGSSVWQRRVLPTWGGAGLNLGWDGALTGWSEVILRWDKFFVCGGMGLILGRAELIPQWDKRAVEYGMVGLILVRGGAKSGMGRLKYWMGVGNFTMGRGFFLLVWG